MAYRMWDDCAHDMSYKIFQYVCSDILCWRRLLVMCLVGHFCHNRNEKQFMHIWFVEECATELV
jgi:hypothetical protein